MKSWFIKLILVNFITVIFIYFIYENMYEMITLPKSIFWIFIITRSISLTILILIIIYLFEITRSHDSLRIFLIAGSMYTLAYILETISFIYLNTEIENYQLFSKNIFILSQTLLTISPIMLMYFIASYFTKRPSFFIFLPVILEAVMEIIFQPLDLTLGKSVYVIDGKIIYYWIYQPKIIGINLLYFSSILWLVSYLIILVLKSKKNTKNKNLNLQQKIFLWGIILVFILSPVVFTIGMLMTDQFAKFIWIAIISRTSVNIGLSFFIIAYIKSNNKLDFFQSQPIYGLYLLDMRKKKVIYDRLFRGNLNFEIIDYLTNNLESLNSMLSEIINVDARIRAIELDNYDLLIGEIENSDLVVIIHVKYQTAVILNRFQTLIEAISSIQNYSRNSIKLIINDIFGV